MKYLISIILIMMIVYSCQKEPLSPPPTVEKPEVEHPVLWENTISSEFIERRINVPVIDENDNIYVLFQQENGDGETVNSQITSFDKDGKIRWENEFAGSYSANLLYQNSSLFFTTSSSENGINISRVYFIHSKNGTVLQTQNQYSGYEYFNPPSASLINQNLYLLTDTGMLSKITCYTLEGNEVWHKNINIKGEEILSNDNHLYVKAFSKVQKYELNDNGCELQWEWQHPESYYISPIQFGNNGNVFFENIGNLYHLNSSGQLEQVLFQDIEAFHFSVNQENEIFLWDSDLAKYNMEGEKIWDITSPYEDNFCCISNGFSIAPDGMIYTGGIFGIYAINPEGEVLWRVPEKTAVFGVNNPAVNSENNLVCLDEKNGKDIYCIKGN